MKNELNVVRIPRQSDCLLPFNPCFEGGAQVSTTFSPPRVGTHIQRRSVSHACTNIVGSMMLDTAHLSQLFMGRRPQTVEIDIVDQYVLWMECFNHDVLDSDELIGSAQCSLLPVFKRGMGRLLVLPCLPPQRACGVFE